MSDDFLSRWSRRKREVAEAEAAVPAPADAPAASDTPASLHDEKKEEAPFDVSTLPPIESINSLTDIKVFMQSGVPAELTRAALRRVWSADPAIRDFIGIAENQWDFTLPASAGGPPGFGPLDPTHDVGKMVADIFGEARKGLELEKAPKVEGPPAQASDPAPTSLRLSDEHADEEPQPLKPAEPDTAPQQTLAQLSSDQNLGEDGNAEADLEDDGLPPAPTHGGALPR